MSEGTENEIKQIKEEFENKEQEYKRRINALKTEVSLVRETVVRIDTSFNVSKDIIDY